MRATNGTGPSAWSNVATAQTTGTVPAAPTGLTATAVSSTQINLAWTDNATNETGFAIERSPDGTTFAPLAKVAAANVTTYQNTGLTALDDVSLPSARDEPHGRTVRVVERGERPDGRIDEVLSPSNLTATAVSSSQINLTWTDRSTNETAFVIERSTNGILFSALATVGPNVTTYSNTGLAAFTSTTIACERRMLLVTRAGRTWRMRGPGDSCQLPAASLQPSHSC